MSPASPRARSAVPVGHPDHGHVRRGAEEAGRAPPAVPRASRTEGPCRAPRRAPGRSPSRAGPSPRRADRAQPLGPPLPVGVVPVGLEERRGRQHRVRVDVQVACGPRPAPPCTGRCSGPGAPAPRPGSRAVGPPPPGTAGRSRGRRRPGGSPSSRARAASGSKAPHATSTSARSASSSTRSPTGQQRRMQARPRGLPGRSPAGTGTRTARRGCGEGHRRGDGPDGLGEPRPGQDDAGRRRPRAGRPRRGPMDGGLVVGLGDPRQQRRPRRREGRAGARPRRAAASARGPHHEHLRAVLADRLADAQVQDGQLVLGVEADQHDRLRPARRRGR